jgi:hypothetical protein
LKLRRETQTKEVESQHCGERSETNPKTESRVRTTVDGFHTTEFEITEDLEKISIVGGTTNVEIMNTNDCDIGGCVSPKQCFIITGWIIGITKHSDS